MKINLNKKGGSGSHVTSVRKQAGFLGFLPGYCLLNPYD